MDFTNQTRKPVSIGKVKIALAGGERHSPVHRTRIEKPKPEPPRQLTRCATLSGSSRSIDGYDHRLWSRAESRESRAVGIRSMNSLALDSRLLSLDFFTHHSASICTQPLGLMSIWAFPSAIDNTSVRLPRKSLAQAAFSGRNAESVVCVSRPSVSSSRTRIPAVGSASGSICVHNTFLA